MDCNYADTCFTAARGSVLAGGCTQVPHRSTLYQHTAVVEILQSSAPGLVMVMMMVGNAAVAATATAANTQNSGAHEYDLSLIHI